MIYTGYFRNNDTSIDPQGQLYKVYIATDYQELGENQYNTVKGSRGGYEILYQVPSDGTELVMGDVPFKVTYDGDSKNIYKPYKCSTATAKFMLPNFIRDFTLVKRNDILVKLLKLKPNVTRYDDHYEKSDGTTLYKTPKYGYIHDLWCLIGESYNFQENDFAYDVEWFGYATPNTYSQKYVRVSDEYELQAQDALSTLKYFDYDVENKVVRSFLSFLNVCLSNIGKPYKNVYSSDGMQVTNVAGKNPIEVLFANDNNYFDEDGEKTNCLEVLESIMQFMGCTMLQFKDNLYLVNYDALGKEMFTFDTFPKVGSPFESYVNSGRKYVIGEVFDLYNNGNGGYIAGSETSLSMSNTYKQLKVKTNEYEYDDITVDCDEDKNLTSLFTFDQFGNWSFPTKYSSGNHSYTFETRKCRFYGEFFGVKTTTDYETITYDYSPDTLNSSGVSLVWNTTPITAPSNYNEVYANHIGCKVVDYNFQELNDDTILSDLMQNYDVKRKYYFYTRPYVNTSNPLKPVMQNENVHVGNAPLYNQPMLKIKTKTLPMRKDQYLHLQGTWTFYNTPVPYEAGWSGSINKLLKICPKYMYVWAKVSIGNEYWLKNKTISTGTSYDYEWSTSECWVKLYYGGFGFTNKDDDAFENSFSFIKNNFGVDQLAIKLPNFATTTARNANITVTFNRPVGCGKDYNSVSGYMYCAACTTLEDFSIDIIDEEEVQWRKKREEGDDKDETQTDNEFTIEMNKDAVDDYGTITMKLSSNYQHKISLASVFISNIIVSPLTPSYYLKPITIFQNVGNGSMSIPESVYAESVAKTYSQPNIMLSLPIFIDKGVTPMHVMKWTSQFRNTKFVIDTMDFNYGSNLVYLSTCEKKVDATLSVDTYWKEVVKNFRRNGDNLYGELPNKAKSKVATMKPSRFYSIDLKEVMRDAILTDNLDSCDLKYVRVVANLSDGCLHLMVPDYLDDYVDGEINTLGELVISYDATNADDINIVGYIPKTPYGGEQNQNVVHNTNVNGYMNVELNDEMMEVEMG